MDAADSFTEKIFDIVNRLRSGITPNDVSWGSMEAPTLEVATKTEELFHEATRYFDLRTMQIIGVFRQAGLDTIRAQSGLIRYHFINGYAAAAILELWGSRINLRVAMPFTIMSYVSTIADCQFGPISTYQMSECADDADADMPHPKSLFTLPEISKIRQVIDCEISMFIENLVQLIPLDRNLAP